MLPFGCTSGGPHARSRFCRARDRRRCADRARLGALTHPEHIAQWYAFDGAQVDLRPGGTIVFSWKEHGTFYGTVERVVRPVLFSYCLASVSPDEQPHAGNTTLVEFTLTRAGERTRVRVVESGFARLTGSDAARMEHAANSDQGWSSGFAALRDYVTRLAA